MIISFNNSPLSALFDALFTVRGLTFVLITIFEPEGTTFTDVLLLEYPNPGLITITFDILPH